MENPDDRASLSIVVATFNSAPWLASTLDALQSAIAGTVWETEVVLVDDGSTDDTAVVLEAVSKRISIPLRVVRQENRGRFLARWEGLQHAKGDWVLLIDSRVLIQPDALAYAARALATAPEPAGWNGHIMTDPSAPLVGRFWDVPTWVFWGHYLSRPRPTVITPENFDRVPKGTTMLLAPRGLLERSMRAAWPEGDARYTSDDTRLLRVLVAEQSLRLDPGFAAVYRPRVSLRAFLGHARDRGTLFVDSYAGTSVLRNLILVALVLLPVLLLAGLVLASVAGSWAIVVSMVAAALVGLLVPAIIAAARSCPGRSVVAYLLYVVPFAGVFWAGLARGLVVNRAAFHRGGKVREVGA